MGDAADGGARMLFVLALRNVRRNMHRLRPVAIVIVAGFSLLLTGNGVLYSINRSFSQGLRTSLTGDFSLSHKDMATFTLLGSSSLLAGEYRQPKDLPFGEDLAAALRSDPGVTGVLGVTTVPALMELHAGDEKKKALEEYYRYNEERGVRVERQSETYYSSVHPLMGMDFTAAAKFFPGLELVSGSFPEPGKPGFLVQEGLLKDMSAWFDPMGVTFRFTSNIDNSNFSIRELPLCGVYRLPLSDPALAPLVLADYASVRDLAGLRRGSDPASALGDDASALLGLDIDELFSDEGADSSGGEGSSAELLDGLAAMFSSGNAAEDLSASSPDDGPWHFLLINTARNEGAGSIKSRLAEAGYGPDQEFLLRDWRATVGGSAMLVRFLQLVLNLGALFVIFGVVLIATNGMTLSIFERRAEFGVIRAMGASKPYVLALVVLESAIVVFGGAVLGLLLGGLAILALNLAGLRVDNQYVIMLLGGKAIRGELSVGLLAWHALGAMAMALAACVSPLRKVLGIQPSRAMA